jgi:hypothetical protein
MSKLYKIQKEMTVWYEVEVEADSMLEALEKGQQELDEGCGEEMEGGSDTGMLYLSDIDYEETYNGCYEDIEDELKEKEAVENKAKELGLPVKWVEALEIV